MQINWFTVIAQVINFLILVWLLKRYLYKPILNAVEEREKKITTQLADAETKKSEAGRERDDFNQKNALFDKQKKEMIDKAMAEAETERQKMLTEARDEANALHTKLEKSVAEAQQNINRDMAQKVQQEVFAIARKALKDLASVSLEEQVTNIFIRRLRDLKGAEKDQFLSAFRSGSGTVVLRSAFELSPKQRADIEIAFNDASGSKGRLQYETSPELVGGIELSADGYKLAWSIAAYLDSLQKNISGQSTSEVLPINKKQDAA